ncbi:MAG: hypothetical protein IPJ51_08445 [Saprospiraceae bacterium]|nr:hypothetical protein [Saprospiraceae bacterium]
MKVHLYFLLLIIFFTSCQSGRELHYFKSGENYYRLKIDECTFMTSSRYLSGYFDEGAVDAYFDEIYRPKKDGVETGGFQHLNTGGTLSTPGNSKLLILLSTKSEDVSNIVGQIAGSEMTLETIARLANKDLIKKNNTLDYEIDVQNAQNEIFKSYIETIMSTTDTTNYEENALKYLNLLALKQGGTSNNFDNSTEALNWFKIKMNIK